MHSEACTVKTCLVFARVMVVVLAIATNAGYGQEYPSKPLRMVTSSPGGGPDFMVRLIGPALASGFGQQVITDNRGGAGGVIPGEMLARAAPDGYTLLVYGSTIWTAPLMRDKTPYDPVRDFAPITLAGQSPNMLIVHPSLPVRSVKELIVLGKARPGEVNFAAGGTGSSSHLAGELFKAMAGIDMVRISYRGTGPAVNAVVAGEVLVMFPSAGSATSHVKSGRLRGVAVTSARPSALAPGLPTVAAAGLPDYESGAFLGIWAPAKTPAALINRLNADIVRVLSQSVVKEKLLNAGIEVVGSSPEDFAAIIKSDITKMGRIIRDGGIREE